MTDTPWLGDACSLVDAFRSGQRSPVEELEATFDAIANSNLNAFVDTDPERAMAVAKAADVNLPLGGVPIGIKALFPFEGWTDDRCSLVFAGRRAEYTMLQTQRVLDAGVVPVGRCNASEFGGLNVSVNKVYGVTHNPHEHGRTAGGSSGGSASAVAGGLVTIASAGDGGGSIRIPGGFNGLVGMKGTAGRIPRGPRTQIHPMTVVYGPMARSVRDVCRWYDVSCGYDMRDPYSLPKHEDYERDLGSFDLQGKRVAIAPELGSTVLNPAVESRVREAAELLVRDAGLTLVDVPIDLPSLGYEWAMANLCQLLRDLGDLWPACRDDLTIEMAFGADVYLNQHVAGRSVGPENNGTLTIPCNIVGNPAISVPVEMCDGLPVGMQIIGRHHEDQLLLDLARIAERERPWPLVAHGAPV